MKSLHFTLILMCVVGGLFFSPVVSGVTSIYDGRELNQGGISPISVAWDRFQGDLKQLISIDIDNYGIEKPEGSLIKRNYVEVDVAGVTVKVLAWSSINTDIIWDYVKIIPEATIKILFGKVVEFFDLLISLFNIGLVSFVEIINTVQAMTYKTLGLEWEYTTGAYSEGDQIYYRSITVYTPDGTEASIGQFIHYIYGLVIGIIIMLITLKILDSLIGIWGLDIPFI